MEKGKNVLSTESQNLLWSSRKSAKSARNLEQNIIVFEKHSYKYQFPYRFVVASIYSCENDKFLPKRALEERLWIVAKFRF